MWLFCFVLLFPRRLFRSVTSPNYPTMAPGFGHFPTIMAHRLWYPFWPVLFFFVDFAREGELGQQVPMCLRLRVLTNFDAVFVLVAVPTAHWATYPGRQRTERPTRGGIGTNNCSFRFLYHLFAQNQT